LQNSESRSENLLSLQSRGTNTHSLSSNFSFPSERLAYYVTSVFRSLRNLKSGVLGRIKKRKYSRGATGAVLDVAILHRIFAFAVKRELVHKNPVQMEGRPGDNPEGGAEPFTANELSLLRKHANQTKTFCPFLFCGGRVFGVPMPSRFIPGGTLRLERG
jgi:hypothetical protein